jgi:hypothetical protein
MCLFRDFSVFRNIRPVVGYPHCLSASDDKLTTRASEKPAIASGLTRAAAASDFTL